MSIQYLQIKTFDDIIKKRAELTSYFSSVGLADTAIYHYVKDGGLFGKKQERIIAFFFQGLNTNPQNLSIFLRDQHEKQTKGSKQKIVKGQFVIYDVFKKTDCVIEINIPGNFQIYKIINSKKELISNMEMEMMYLSSVLRAMQGKNIAWGRIYCLFKAKNILDEFKSFMDIFLRVIEHNDFYISDDFENISGIKGSHASSILFSFIREKHIIHHAIEIIESHIKSKGGYKNCFPKLAIFLAELYSEIHQYSKSLSLISAFIQKYNNDPFLLYYQGKYMFKLMTVHQSLIIVNSIIQYNQFQTWILAAEIHIELKNYSEALVCLNHASKGSGKVSKNYPRNNIEAIYAEFDKIGKKKVVHSGDDLTRRPKLISVSENPLSLRGNVEQQFKSLIETEYWKLNQSNKIIFGLLEKIRERIDRKRFHQILQNTFEETKKHFNPVIFKKGMTESMFVEVQNKEIDYEEPQKDEEELPNFLQEESMEASVQQVIKNNRNLSIIPEIESVIENSQYEQKQKEDHANRIIHIKKQMSEGFYKILKILLNQSELEKAQFQDNFPKILPVYNKLRSASKFNNYYTFRMFEIMIQTGNYKSIVVLIAETLDLLEKTGIKKIQVLPYWMEKYVYTIIQEKGLKYLNQIIQKLNFYDEALIDTIEMAKSWRIKGCTF